MEDQTDGNLTVYALVASIGPEGREVPHYKAGPILLAQSAPSAPLLALPKGETQLASAYYQNDTLFHGASFQAIEKSINTPKGLALSCHLSAVESEALHHFESPSFNPFTADSLLQAMLIWAKRQTGKGSLPLSIKQVDIFGPIPFESDFFITVEPKKETPTSVCADVVVLDSTGRILTRFRGAEVTVSEQLAAQFV